MNTFLPYPSFDESAKCLDYKRLGKQRVEAKQILEINLKILNPENYFICFSCRNEFENSLYNLHEEHCLQQTDYKPLKLEIGRSINHYKIKWENHPAVLMWRGYEHVLSGYGYEMCEEWIKRGYKDNLISFFHFYLCGGKKDISLAFPDWLGETYIHLTHQSNLIRKDPGYYRPIFGVDIPSDLPYFWPVKKEK